MTAPQHLCLRARRCVAGLLAAVCVAFSPSLKAAVTAETFTDYNAFLNLLGPTAQVVNFDDVPTTNGYAYLDSNRYAGQGIVINGLDGAPTVFASPAGAVSPPNAFTPTFAPGAAFNDPPGALREDSEVGFTGLTSAFGTFFINPYAIDAAGTPGQSLIAHGSFGYYSAQPTLTQPAFLGLATVDSATGQLVPAISYVDIFAGIGHDASLLDNFTFATPVSPVPEGNAGALLAAAALAVVGLYRRRAATA